MITIKEYVMAQSRREQLRNFVPSYRAGYLASGSSLLEPNEEEIIQKMEKADVQNESQAEQQGRKDGFNERDATSKK